MQKWYQNRYVQAAFVAFVTGGIAACTVYAGTMTDGLDMRHTVKVVMLAFLAPFSILVSVLPKITDIITPTVRIVSTLPIREAAPVAHQEVITTGSETIVTVTPPDAPRPEQSSDSVAAAVQQRTPTGRFAPRAAQGAPVPPAPPAQP